MSAWIGAPLRPTISPASKHERVVLGADVWAGFLSRPLLPTGSDRLARLGRGNGRADRASPDDLAAAGRTVTEPIDRKHSEKDVATQREIVSKQSATPVRGVGDGMAGVTESAAAAPQRIRTLTAFTMISAVVLPFLGLIAAMLLMWGGGFSWAALGVFVGMYLATILGVTVGYHRCFTHRSFETLGVVKAILAVFGSMSAEGPVLKWVAMHRRHHQHSDEAEDPHSPHHYGAGAWGVIRGLWHAHVGWLFRPEPGDLMRYVGDLRRSRMMRVVSALFPLWMLVGLLLPTVICGVITLSWSGALLGFLWGGLVRILAVHHVTWSVNSICHFWGTRPFRTGDDSRNNPIFGVLGLGEGWHNNHHAFPTSARHGLRWWQFDLSYLVIRAMAAVNLAWDVRRPSPELVLARAARTEVPEHAHPSPTR